MLTPLHYNANGSKISEGGSTTFSVISMLICRRSRKCPDDLSEVDKIIEEIQ